MGYFRFSFIAILLTFLSCGGKKTDDVRFNFYRYYANGEIEACGDTLNGMLHGLYREYYEGGEIRFEAEYKHNKLNGEVLIYYPSGNIKNDLLYEDHLHVGAQYEFYDSNIRKVKYKLLYTTYKDREILISDKEFDIDGSLIVDKSRVVTNLVRDTFKLGEKFEVEFILSKPEFEYYNIHIGNFDRKLRLVDSVNYSVYGGTGYSGTVSFVANNLGLNVTRGYMEDYKFERIVSDIEYKTYGKLNNWFDIEYYVE
jgi:antitoxin component YwqK of YwqJK toxin-antitoxin module